MVNNKFSEMVTSLYLCKFAILALVVLECLSLLEASEGDSNAKVVDV